MTWVGDGQILRTNPDTGLVEDLTPSSGPLPSKRTNKIYSKWIYIEVVDAFVGIQDPRDGVWVYQLPKAGTLPPPAASFEERCDAPDVVFCDPLDTEGPWGVDAFGKGSRPLRRSQDSTRSPGMNGSGHSEE